MPKISPDSKVAVAARRRFTGHVDRLSSVHLPLEGGMRNRLGSRSRALSLELLRPHGFVLAAAAVLLLVESAATLALPLLAGQLADALLEESARQSVFIVAGLMIAVLAGLTGARIAGNLTVMRVSDDMLRVLRCRVFDRLIRMPMDEHHRRARGDQLSLLTTDAQAISSFLSGTLPGLLPAAVTCVGALVMMATLSPLLAGAVAIAVPPGVIALRLWMRVIRQRARELHDAHGVSISVAEEAIELLPVIKAEAREGWQSNAYAASTDELFDRSRRLRHVLSPLRPVIQFASTAGIVGLLVVAVPVLGPSSLSPGELVTLILYGVLIARPLAALADAYGRWNGAQGAFSRLIGAVDAPGETPGGRGRVPSRLEQGIAWEGIHFGYQPDRPVFSDFTLKVGSGECVALTGPNGCGKSTLVWLLLRFFDPQAGRVTIDGVDVRALDLQSLRRSVALVPQRVWLFQGSVADNIRLGCPEATQEAIERAARLAAADGFIRALPQGYDTRLGPRGTRISGGQQQRLALARALIRPTPILVLDEATSMFDESGEREVAETLEAVKRGRTVILVTHRPELLKLADRRIELAPEGTTVARRVESPAGSL